MSCWPSSLSWPNTNPCNEIFTPSMMLVLVFFTPKKNVSSSGITRRFHGDHISKTQRFVSFSLGICPLIPLYISKCKWLRPIKFLPLKVLYVYVGHVFLVKFPITFPNKKSIFPCSINDIVISCYPFTWGQIWSCVHARQ